MSPDAWLLWFTAQSVVLIAILAIAMLGVTGRLTHAKRARPIGKAPRHTHHHLGFLHRPAH